jgi:hypothetical protein
MVMFVVGGLCQVEARSSVHVLSSERSIDTIAKEREEKAKLKIKMSWRGNHVSARRPLS